MTRRCGSLTAIAILLLAAGTAQAQLVDNTGQPTATHLAAAIAFNTDQAQAFTTGDHAGGYKLTSVTLDMVYQNPPIAPTYAVRILADSNGSPGGELGTLTNPPSLSDGLNTFTASGGIDLAPSTTYYVVLDAIADGTSQTRLAITESDDEVGQAGWSVGDRRHFRNAGSTSWGTSTNAGKIAIHGSALAIPAVPPAAPERLQVTSRPSGLSVKWRPPVAGEHSSPVTGYNLGWRPAGSEDWTVLQLAAGDDYPIDNDIIRQTIDGLENGTLYEVRVQAVSDAGDGPWSASVTGTPVVPWLAPYWQGTGGFVVRPADGRSAVVRISCGGRRNSSREYAGDDGLIVRDVQRCVSEDGRPLLADVTLEGIEGGGWYWINGDRNVAVAPLIVEESLNGELRPPIPGGVTASPSGDYRFVREVTGRPYATLMVHEGNGLMGIVPHLVDMEGDGAHLAPYWKGSGGIVGRPLDGESAEVRLSCGDSEAETYTLEPGEDGTIATLLPAGCFDSEGGAIAGHLEADGLEDGAWYWLNGPAMPAVAPLVGRGRAGDTLTAPLIPEGVEAKEGPLGTLFSRGLLMGVVPRVRIAPQ